MAGATVGNSGYSNVTPFSHSKMGQQSGNGAVLFVFSDNLHFGLAFGNGPQSSTCKKKKNAALKWINYTLFPVYISIGGKYNRIPLTICGFLSRLHSCHAYKNIVIYSWECQAR